MHCYYQSCRFSLDNASSSEFLPVANYPAGLSEETGRSYFDYGSAVYVDKLNRIYIMGGLTSNGTVVEYHDSIWYIDL
jgi:hypothetical protein